MSVEARGGRWSWRNIEYRVTYCVWNSYRSRDLSWWRWWWIDSWSWIFYMWRTVIYPHLRPRTYAKHEYRFLLGMRIPPHINGFVFGDKTQGYCCHLIEHDGPWDMCCFQRDTVDQVKTTASHFVDKYAKEAGTIGDGYMIQCHEREPTAADKAYTR